MNQQLEVAVGSSGPGIDGPAGHLGVGVGPVAAHSEGAEVLPSPGTFGEHVEGVGGEEFGRGDHDEEEKE
uniref:Uncharacterized protein n=1 Tax=Steinernema glaseri TaxID=37863 RepID=A0A1I8AI71_9BILA